MEPSVLIARFWYHFTRFEYSESIPLLENWIATLQDPYLRIIAENNLAESFFSVGRCSKARELITRTIKKSELQGYMRLFANGLHIRARCSTELGDLKKSNQDLQRALQTLKTTVTSDASIFRRQLAINEAIETSSVDPINKFRASALRAGLWETLRELDFQSLRIQFRDDVLQKLYFGTPYPAYRERILKTFPNAVIHPEFTWGSRQVPSLDLATGELSEKTKKWFQPTRLTLLTLRALLQDHYRPLSTREIFAALFPNEDFEPSRSDDRVHQCLARTRRWLSEVKLPLKIELKESSYTLAHMDRPRIALKIPAELPPRLQARDAKSFVEVLRSHFTDDFSAQDARTRLALSSATTIRRLTDAVSSGQLLRLGAGKRTTYRFAKV